LALVKTIVTAKIHNQAAVVYRHNAKEETLKQRKASVQGQKTIDQSLFRNQHITKY
jgi:CRISPR-associated protein Cas1